MSGYKKVMNEMYGIKQKEKKEKKLIQKPKPTIISEIKSEFEDYPIQKIMAEVKQPINETLPALGKEYSDFKKAEKLYIQSIRKLAMKAGKVEKVYDKQIMHSLKVFLGKGMEKFKNALDDVLMKLQ